MSRDVSNIVDYHKFLELQIYILLAKVDLNFITCVLIKSHHYLESVSSKYTTKILNKICYGLKIISDCDCSIGITSVSYTHLDVYKRQSKMGSMWACMSECELSNYQSAGLG